MIRLFCAKRGSGKTKNLIGMANDSIENTKGEIVFIDDDMRNAKLIRREVRVISTENLGIDNEKSLYGMLCGIVSQNYDVEQIYIDGMSRVISKDINSGGKLFKDLNNLSKIHDVNVFINVNSEELNHIPENIREYVS